MALINDESEDRLVELAVAAGSAFAVLAIGTDFAVGAARAAGSLVVTPNLSLLESSFVAGKVANQIGADRVRKMSLNAVERFVQGNAITLTEAESVVLDGLKGDAARGLKATLGRWTTRIRNAVTLKNREWRGALSTTDFKDDALRGAARLRALKDLKETLRGDNDKFRTEADRLVQTEANLFYQEGQVASVPGTEMVYKIPRKTACPQCLRLHVSSSGAPRLYRLSDVAGNSNQGRPAFSWVFTIGPVHPYCYCILYRVVQRAPEKKNVVLARAKKASREPLRRTVDGAEDNSCGVESPLQMFEDQIAIKGEHTCKEPHHDYLRQAVQALYHPDN
jgi:hypothetical protein